MAFADDGMAVHHGALMPEDLMADGGDILGDASILVPMFLLQLGAHPPNVCGLVARLPNEQPYTALWGPKP